MSITDTAAGTDPQPEKSPPDHVRHIPPGPSRPGGVRAVQALAVRLHFYAGVFVAPFILIAAVTGALYAVAPTLESMVDRDLLHVDSTGPALSLSEQVTAAVSTQPSLTPVAVDPAQQAGDTTRVLFDDPSLGESERRAVFVDPATAHPVGDSVVYGSTGALPLRTWIDVLHRNLHLGEFGRLYSETAASWMWVIALAGLVVWVRRSGGSWRRLVWRSRASGRAQRISRHATVGVWILLPLLFLSATGLTWSAHAGSHITSMREQLSWTTPAVDTALSGTAAEPGHGGGHAGHGGHAMSPSGPASMPAERITQVDTVLETARAHNLEGPLEITVPTDDHTAFTVQERRLSGVYTQDSVAVDGATGEVTSLLRYEDWPLPAKLANWGIQLHMGMLFGPANQLLLLATMVALIVVIGRGYLMWWRRRPTRRTGRVALGRAPARGMLRQAPWWIGVPLVAAAVLLGWFAPVLGVTLCAFLIVDLGLALRAHRRTTTET
ncbi:PepSY-associated TM helix domain-containing protein [Nocardia vermiculata]|uniref:PepSY-associated TM helix domain-containing protein n=1 Tax=Nocardia vermiculata TaxID=257274 RepID=UPI000AB1E12D|nr:PepSY domain-containing protein [Nocardia vermiculata]